MPFLLLYKTYHCLFVSLAKWHYTYQIVTMNVHYLHFSRRDRCLKCCECNGQKLVCFEPVASFLRGKQDYCIDKMLPSISYPYLSKCNGNVLFMMFPLYCTVLHCTLSPLHISPALSPWQTVANDGGKRQARALCQHY